MKDNLLQLCQVSNVYLGLDNNNFDEPAQNVKYVKQARMSIKYLLSYKKE